MVRTHKSRQRAETRASQRHRRGKLWDATVCLERDFGRGHLGRWVVAEPSPYCYLCRDLAKAHKKTGISWPAPWGVNVMAEAKKITSLSEKMKMSGLEHLGSDLEAGQDAAQEDLSKTGKRQRKGHAASKQSTSHGFKANRIVVTDEMIEDAYLNDAKAVFHNSRSRTTRSILPEILCTPDQKDVADLQRQGYISENDYCITGGIGLEDVVRLRDEPSYSLRYVKSKPRKGPVARKVGDHGIADDSWSYVGTPWILPELEWDFVDDSVSVQSWVDLVDLDSMSDLAI